MEPSKIIKPRPNKLNPINGLCSRMNNLTKLQIEKESSTSKSAKNTKSEFKNPQTAFLKRVKFREFETNPLTNGNDYLSINSIDNKTTKPTEFIFSSNQNTASSYKLKSKDLIELSGSFFEECANELTKQDSENEILSIINGDDNYNINNFYASCNSFLFFNCDDKIDNENINSEVSQHNFRSSLPPIRPKNPFFKNFDGKDDLVQAIVDNENQLSMSFEMINIDDYKELNEIAEIDKINNSKGSKGKELKL